MKLKLLSTAIISSSLFLVNTAQAGNTGVQKHEHDIEQKVKSLQKDLSQRDDAKYQTEEQLRKVIIDGYNYDGKHPNYGGVVYSNGRYITEKDWEKQIQEQKEKKKQKLNSEDERIAKLSVEKGYSKFDPRYTLLQVIGAMKHGDKTPKEMENHIVKIERSSHYQIIQVTPISKGKTIALLTNRRYSVTDISVIFTDTDQTPVNGMGAAEFKNHYLVFGGFKYITLVTGAQKQIPVFTFFEH